MVKASIVTVAAPSALSPRPRAHRDVGDDLPGNGEFGILEAGAQPLRQHARTRARDAQLQFSGARR